MTHDEVVADTRSEEIDRTISVAFFVLVGLLSIILAASLWISNEINERSQRAFIGEVIPLRAAIGNLELAMVNQETGVQAFLITSEEASLAPYRAGIRDRDEAIRTIRDSGLEQPRIQALLAQAVRQVDGLERYFEAQIKLIRTGDAGLRAARRNLSEGKAQFDRFRLTAAALDREREAVTAEAVRDQDRLVDRLTVVLVVFGGLALAISLGLGLRVPRRVGALMGDLASERDAAVRARAIAEEGQARFAFLARLSAALEDVEGAEQRVERGVELAARHAGLAAVVPHATSMPTVALVADGGGASGVHRVALSPDDDGLAALARRVSETNGHGVAEIALKTSGVDSPQLPVRMLAVPFRLANAPAVLAVATAEDDPRADTPAFVRSIATKIGLAADNARLLSEQRSLAWTLQKALLPRELPKIPGMELAARYRPAASHSTVGGDFYDVFATEKGWYVVVGDVCGKGPEAAQLTGLVRHTLRTAAIADPAAAPSSLLFVLNRAVLDQTAGSDYCTVVCARVGEATDTGRPVLCSAGGHPAPFVRKRDGETERLPTRGPLVGVFDDVDFADVELRLQPGDIMFFYTDGLLEARSGGRFFGSERLRETLRLRRSAESLVAFVEETIIAFANDGDLNDDVALVAVHEAESASNR